jgi:hypothetical protein
MQFCRGIYLFTHLWLDGVYQERYITVRWCVGMCGAETFWTSWNWTICSPTQQLSEVRFHEILWQKYVH